MRRITRWAGLLPVVLLAAGCASEHRPGGPTTNPEARRKAEADIREVVFRRLFEKNASAAQQKATAYFLTVEGADPDADLLARFAGNEPPVKPGSASTSSASEGVVDRETGTGGALRFSVSEITFESDDRATLSAEYYEAGLSAAGYDFVLQREDDGWVVVEQKMTWIS